MESRRKDTTPHRKSTRRQEVGGRQDIIARKLIRPRITTYRARPSSTLTRPRSAPPEQTNAETNYLIRQMESKTPMVVKLLDGEEIRGWIEYYDRHCIKINRDKPPNYFIRKDQILYMYKDPVRPRKRDH